MKVVESCRSGAFRLPARIPTTRAHAHGGRGLPMWGPVAGGWQAMQRLAAIRTLRDARGSASSSS
jgi:hypothetical protein